MKLLVAMMSIFVTLNAANARQAQGSSRERVPELSCFEESSTCLFMRGIAPETALYDIGQVLGNPQIDYIQCGGLNIIIPKDKNANGQFEFTLTANCVDPQSKEQMGKFLYQQVFQGILKGKKPIVSDWRKFLISIRAVEY